MTSRRIAEFVAGTTLDAVHRKADAPGAVGPINLQQTEWEFLSQEAARRAEKELRHRRSEIAKLAYRRRISGARI